MDIQDVHKLREKATPGPWKFTHEQVIISENGEVICSFFATHPRVKHNMNLIRKLPEVLDLLDRQHLRLLDLGGHVRDVPEPEKEDPQAFEVYFHRYLGPIIPRHKESAQALLQAVATRLQLEAERIQQSINRQRNETETIPKAEEKNV